MTGLDSLIAELKAGHAERNPRSAAAFESALRVMPGGNSRTQLYFEPFPFYVDYAEGPYLYDLDAHRYLDVVNNYTSLIHGHPDAETVRVIAEQAARGTAHAAPAPSEIELAEEITGRVTSMEMVRFTNSGSEAVLYAVRLARHVTGRADVIKVEGRVSRRRRVRAGVESDLPTSYRQAIGPLTALFYLLMERGVFTALSRVVVAFSTAMGDIQLDIEREKCVPAPGRPTLRSVHPELVHTTRVDVVVTCPPPTHSSLQFWNPVPVLQRIPERRARSSLRKTNAFRCSTRRER